MHNVIEIGKWLGIVMAGFALAGALVVGVLSWLLNHPDRETTVKTATHIAVLDDEIDITTLVAGYLRGHGYRVSQVHDGRALMQLMPVDPPALVLLDLGLARRRRLLHRPAAARALAMRPGHRHRPRRRRRQGRGTRGRRRRLRDQALRLARARRARQGRPATHRGLPTSRPRRRPARGYRFASWELDAPARRLISPQGREVGLTSGEFDLLLAFVRQSGPRAVARLPAGADARPRSGAVRSHDRRAGGAPAQEAGGRCRRSEDHQVGSRRGLHPGAERFDRLSRERA